MAVMSLFVHTSNSLWITNFYIEREYIESPLGSAKETGVMDSIKKGRICDWAREKGGFTTKIDLEIFAIEICAIIK